MRALHGDAGAADADAPTQTSASAARAAASERFTPESFAGRNDGCLVSRVMRVYFAGPLFTPYERRFIDECAARLRAEAIEVFVPHENVLATAETTAAAVFAKDLAGLAAANAVVALLDGPVIDDGTACEIGLFYGLMQSDPSKKGIVGLVTDLRAERAGAERGLNLFVLGCIEAAGEVCTSIDDVLAVLSRWS